jgi:hypothetical protein
MINITVHFEPDTAAYTIVITEKDPSPQQAPSPPQDTTIHSQSTSPDPMQLDLPDSSDNVKEPTIMTTEALIHPKILLVPISVTLHSMKS